MKALSFKQNIGNKPSWLDKKINLGSCRKVKSLLRDLHLHTVCEESLCPNLSECFNKRVATFMILGDRCTRSCSFCAVIKKKPKSVDISEPKRIREAVTRLGLNYVVITSPTRDDLNDGGADIFCQTVKEILSIGIDKKVEALIPDFKGQKDLIAKIAFSGVVTVAHNLETVPSLYIKVRKQAEYKRSLRVLKIIKQINKGILTKSGLMLGLGEKDHEIIEVLSDLKEVGCDIITLGQYLPPSLEHYPLKEYIHPEKFSFFKVLALKFGFKKVLSSAYARSSYLASSLAEA